MYILRCADHTLYVGSTTDLDRRLEEHASGLGAKYTSWRLPVELVYREEFDRVDEAYAREKQVQRWGRAKRDALIDGRLDDLNRLGRKRPKRAGSES